MQTRPMRVVVLAGGFGGARMAHGFALLGDAVELTVIVNTGDDLELHGLYVSPDLDTVMYTLAGLANAETGWGVRDETWSALGNARRATAGRPGSSWATATWRRTSSAARRCARATPERGNWRGWLRALGVGARLLPMTDDAGEHEDPH